MKTRSQCRWCNSTPAGNNGPQWRSQRRTLRLEAAVYVFPSRCMFCSFRLFHRHAKQCRWCGGAWKSQHQFQAGVVRSRSYSLKHRCSGPHPHLAPAHLCELGPKHIADLKFARCMIAPQLSLCPPWVTSRGGSSPDRVRFGERSGSLPCRSQCFWAGPRQGKLIVIM